MQDQQFFEGNPAALPPEGAETPDGTGRPNGNGPTFFIPAGVPQQVPAQYASTLVPIGYDDLFSVVDDGTQEMLPTWTRHNIYERLAGNTESVEAVMREAQRRGMSGIAFLNLISPPSYADPMSCWERLLQLNQLFLHSNPRLGYWASPLEQYLKTPVGRFVLKESVDSLYRHIIYTPFESLADRRAALNSQVNRSDALPPGSWDLPWADAATARYSQILDMAIPLDLMISRYESIRGGDYREPEIEQTRGARSQRVDQGDNFPVRKLGLRQQYNKLYKRGIAVQVTDEAMRRCRVDRVLEELMLTMMNDKIAMVYEANAVVFNGDENDGTAAVKYDPYDFDPNGAFKTTGKPTHDMWLAWRGTVRQESPYRIDLLIGDVFRNIQMVKLPSGVTGDIVALSDDYRMNAPINRFESVPADADVVYYIDVNVDDVENFTKDMQMGINRLFGGITFLSEIGGTYTEQDRNILNQTQLLVSSMVYGMGKRQKGKCASYVGYKASIYNSQGSWA